MRVLLFSSNCYVVVHTHLLREPYSLGLLNGMARFVFAWEHHENITETQKALGMRTVWELLF